MLFWIIDEEWPDYEVETAILKERYPDCEIRFSKNDYAADLEAFGYKADAVIAQVYVYIPKEVIERLENCKCIALFGGGFDRVDVAFARTKGISVTNVQGYCAEDLADYVMAGIYHFGKKLDFYAEGMDQKLWGAQAVKPQNGDIRRISTNILLIIGFGRIGREVAQKAKSLGIEVIAYDPYVSAEKMAEFGVTKTDWDEGMKKADFISVNAKLYEETEGLIKYADFEKMKSSAYLINTARGKIIIEEDMIRAVNEGQIAGAVVDVISNEPPAGNEAIFSCKNIVVTPHVSYISEESYTELKRRAATNAVCMLDGGRPGDVVN